MGSRSISFSEKTFNEVTRLCFDSYFSIRSLVFPRGQSL